MNFSFEDTLKEEDTFLCQKRTSPHKQFVILKPTSDVIFKGPYSVETLKRIDARSRIFSSLPFIVFPIREQNGEIKILNSELGPFIMYPNLIKDYPIKVQVLHTEAFSSGNRSYRVIERNGVIKLGDYIKDFPESETAWVFSSDKMFNLLVVYITFFIFSVGDVGPHNTLVDINKKFIYIIDYDENTTISNNMDREIFFFKKDPAKKYFPRWLSSARSVYPQLINYFKASRIDLKENVALAISLLEKFNGSGSGSSAPISSTGHLAALPEPSSAPLPLTQTGKMEWKGPFGGSKTFSGFSIDVMKSGVQKYIRREMTEKALICTFELYRMPEINSNAISVRSNLFNRLMICAAEDIGPAHINLTLSVISHLKGNSCSEETLIAIIDMMSSSKKTRIGSHIWRAYATPQGRVHGKSLGLTIDDVDVPSNTLQSLLDNFHLRLKVKNPNCLVWLSYYILYGLGNGNPEEAFKKQKIKKGGPMKNVWEILKLYLNSQMYSILSWAFFNFTESRPFLVLAILCLLYDEAGGIVSLDSYGTKFAGSNILTKLKTGNYPGFDIDEFIVDKHTYEGKRKGANREKFVSEGAVVTNESPKYQTLGQIFEKIYMMN